LYRIFRIIKEGNFTATSMQQAYQLIDRAHDKSVVTPSARDLAKQRGLMKPPSRERQNDFGYMSP
jgi:hypothetical protein